MTLKRDCISVSNLEAKVPIQFTTIKQDGIHILNMGNLDVGDELGIVSEPEDMFQHVVRRWQGQTGRETQQPLHLLFYHLQQTPTYQNPNKIIHHTLNLPETFSLTFLF